MKVYELLEDATKWIKGVLCRDASGFAVDPEGDEACQWCVLGGLHHCYRKPDAYNKAYGRLTEFLRHCGLTIPQWNDSVFTTHCLLIKALKELDI